MATQTDYLNAETVLVDLSKLYEKHFQQTAESMSRDEMQKHADDRAAILRVRTILVDLAESGLDA